ncbi:MAG TPA: ABC transporter ATP-binding protein [Candidatus Binataceae bacterium]|nr:ABC transporter ATP-binding protein [Candidatus Binataceae bacterium]
MRALRFERVSILYGHVVALSEVTLDCGAGRVTCLVGPNGAGKTSALASAAGLVRHAAGRIMIGTREVLPYESIEGRSYLPQNGTFSKLLTVREVLNFAASVTSASEKQYKRALEATGAHQVFDSKIGQLSGGWERRVGLAWALLQPADVLLLDEPLVGLDPETLDRVVTHLARRAAEGDTILLASHDFEAIDALRPSVAVLDKGRVVARFDPEEGELRELYRVSMKGSPARTRAAVSHAPVR